MKKRILLAVFVALTLCACSKNTEVAEIGRKETEAVTEAAREASGQEESESPAETVPPTPTESTEALAEDLSETLPGMPEDTVLREPDFSLRSEEEIKAYMEGVSLEDRLAISKAEYLSDAVFFEGEGETVETVIEGLDTGDWVEPGLHHPDFSELLSELEEGWEEWENESEAAGEDEAESSTSGMSTESVAGLIPEEIIAKLEMVTEEDTIMLYGTGTEEDYRAIADHLKETGGSIIKEAEIGGVFMVTGMTESGSMITVSFTSGTLTIAITAS